MEARQYDDPDVKNYVKDRVLEEIVVGTTSALKDIERKIIDIVAPVLDHLRDRGAMRRITGDGSLVAYSILSARQKYYERRGADKSLHPVFAAAHRLLMFKDTLNSSGIGCLRTALFRFVDDEKKTGELAKIAKSTQFRELMDLVQKSTADPTSNNPKLAKLQEVLLEHFERARLSGVSSRVIVFSQFRDSVREIVDLLSKHQPILRPRQFVGQSDGAQNEDGGRARGMAQSEQQAVVEQFTEDVYNVLVCTSKSSKRILWIFLYRF